MHERLTILSQSHLCRNPRVWKEALALKDYYKITIITCFYDNGLLREDQDNLSVLPSVKYISYIDIKRNSLLVLISKALRKLAILVQQYFKIESPYTLGYSPHRLLKKAMRENADKYVVHQELPSWVGMKLIQKGYKVYFDLEDWYSEDLLPSARSKRPIKLLEKIEKNALACANGVWTTSQVMAEAMAKKYSENTPGVVYNTFPDSFNYQQVLLKLEYKDRSDLATPSFFWFSQTIGPGRGLEELMAALRGIHLPYQLHLRGNISQNYRRKLLNLFPGNKSCIFIHNLVPNEELPKRIAEHDVGLALERNMPKSRNFTVTNKILQYLQSGLVVIASNTNGQVEIGSKAKKAVIIYEIESINGLSSILRTLLSDKEKLKELKINARNSYLESFSWNKETIKFFQYIN